MSLTQAFEPMTDATHGLLPAVPMTVTVAGTPVSGTLPASSGAAGVPNQIAVANETGSWGQLNIGTLAQITSFPASATQGFDIPPNGLIVISIAVNATTWSFVLGAAGTGTAKLYRGEGK
jgi:hypothetical protein